MGEENQCRGIFSSEKDLKDGVNYWIRLNPTETLSFSEFYLDRIMGPDAWDWAYIAPEANPYKLASGGGDIPQYHYWGSNLIGIDWEVIPAWNLEFGILKGIVLMDKTDPNTWT